LLLDAGFAILVTLPAKDPHTSAASSCIRPLWSFPNGGGTLAFIIEPSFNTFLLCWLAGLLICNFDTHSRRLFDAKKLAHQWREKEEEEV
jgi:hypothetical protein